MASEDPVDDAVQRAFKWLDDDAATSAWIKRAELDLKHQLKVGNGIAKISGLLPEYVAEGVRLVLEGVPSDSWERAGMGEHDDTGCVDRVQHGFAILEVEPHEVLLGVSRLLSQLLPGTLPNFSAARYTKSDHIAPHDDLVPESYTASEVERIITAYGGSTDSASCPFRSDRTRLRLREASTGFRESSTAGNDDSANAQLEAALLSGDLEAIRKAVDAGGRAVAEDNEYEIPYTRVWAMAYYLTRNWKDDYGGKFVDLQTNVSHSPDFNTMVVFDVPRLHEVTAVCAPPASARHSIFGWWLMEESTFRKRPGGTKALKRPAAAVASTPCLKRPAAATLG